MSVGSEYDVVVIGGGVGGLAAGVQLVLAGHKPLILEGTDRIGGRFSTIEKDGFLIPTGAIAIELGGPWHELFSETLGIDGDLRIPSPAVRTRIKGKDVTAGSPTWEFLIQRVTKSAAGLANAVHRAGPDEGGEGGMMLSDWARKYTRSKIALSLFQSLAASIFTVNADELPAATFFGHLRNTGGYKSFGFAPHGNVAIADAVADEIRSRGGTVEVGWTATSIEIEDGVATAVIARAPDGDEHRIAASAVISDVGPVNTAKLVAGTPVAARFAERVADCQPTSMLALAFTSEDELLPLCPGMVNFTGTKRLCSMGNLTALCPELAPGGRKLYDAYSVPRPSLGGEFDVELERRLLEEDLRKTLPGFEHAETVMFKAMRGTETPAMRCAPGTDPGVRTPVPNLFDVGDGVKPDGTSGTSACAATAEIAVSALLEGRDVDQAVTAAA